MTQEWRPDEGYLQSLRGLLADLTEPGRAPSLAQTHQLQACNGHPDICFYYATLFGRGDLLGPMARAMAGLQLKHLVLRGAEHADRKGPVWLPAVQAATLASLGDADPLVRSTAGTLVAVTVAAFSLAAWPGLIDHLVQHVSHPAHPLTQGCLSALSRLCEDNCKKLCSEAYEAQVRVLVPKLLEWLHIFQQDGGQPGLLRHALTALLVLTPFRPASLQAHLPAYIDLLAKITSSTGTTASNSDSDQAYAATLPRLVCQNLVAIFDAYLQDLTHLLPSMMSYMLGLLDTPEGSIRLEACEFWLALARKLDLVPAQLLHALYPRLLPQLLACMRYEPTDPIYIDNILKAAAAAAGDDVAPRQYRSKQGLQMQLPQGTTPSADSDADADSDVSDDDEDEDEAEEVGVGGSSDWNLRKCASATLDALSLSLKEEEVQTILLPCLSSFLNRQDDWTYVEVGILALGAVSQGCYDMIKGHMEVLMPMFMAKLRDPVPLLRSIACWTCGRYAPWVFEQYYDKQNATYLQQIMQSLCDLLMDANKRVQGSAFNCISVYAELIGPDLTLHFLPLILPAMVKSYPSLQRKNLLAYYDCLAGLFATLADTGSLAEHPNASEWFSVLAPTLLNRFVTTSEYDPDIFAIYECLTHFITAFTHHFGPAAQPLYDRTIQTTLTALRSTGGDEYEDDLAVSGLELLSTMIQFIPKDLMASIIQSHSVSIMTVFSESTRHSSSSVRQSAFALVGDAARQLMVPPIKGAFHLLARTCDQHMDPTHAHSDITMSEANNVVWSLGEWAAANGPDILPFVEPFAAKLTHILTSTSSAKTPVPRALRDNIALCLARLAVLAPATLNAQLPQLLPAWCSVVLQMTNRVDQHTILAGICTAVMANPGSALASLPHLLTCIAKVMAPNLPASTTSLYTQIVDGFKNGLGKEQWDREVMQKLPSDVASVLVAYYP